ATILKWVKKPGDKIALDETVLEIATDKVDSEIPSPVEGTLVETLFPEDAVVEIGKVIAVIETDASQVAATPSVASQENATPVSAPPAEVIEKIQQPVTAAPSASQISSQESSRFYSPLVRSIAKEEGISLDERESIEGSGAQGRVTKQDMVNYLQNRSSKPAISQATTPAPPQKSVQVPAHQNISSDVSGGNVEIVEMDRMRKL